MSREIITLDDLNVFKIELLESIERLLEGKNNNPKKYLRSKEVEDMLGISPGNLQNFRITGQLKYSKINGTIFYQYDDVITMLKDYTVEKKSIFKSKK